MINNQRPQNAPGAASTWARALRNIAGLPEQTNLTLPGLVDGLADQHGDRPALRSTTEALSFRSLAQRKNQLARWTRSRTVQPGEIICVLMRNAPAYVATWLGITQTGAVAALLNTNLIGDALVQAITRTRTRHIIVDDATAASFNAVRHRLPHDITCWVPPGRELNQGDAHLDLAAYDSRTLTEADGMAVTAAETALLIFTSGTTGLPKAARISHYRVLEWSFWFAGMMDVQASDRLYDCLPMYHSTGGVAAIGAMLVGGGTVVIRERFSATAFWRDIRNESCTIFLYIGELCRYLLNAAPENGEAEHTLRLCCGNGLQPEVWNRFVARFAIPQVLEFYASTEGNVSLYNVEGKPGSIGRVPAFLAHRFPVELVAYDTVSENPVRGSDGYCVRVQPGQAGEAIGKIAQAGAAGPAAFEGYTDKAATEQKILRNVFKPGDAWFRTGDLMLRDKGGFYYFIDRLGDTFRWKGENISTTQVADAINACRGVEYAVAYGVALPGTDGKVGMAAIVVRDDFDFAALHAWLAEALPGFARPRYVRRCRTIESTGTFKPIKTRLMAEGLVFDTPTDTLYVEDQAARTYRQVPRDGCPAAAAAASDTAAIAAASNAGLVDAL